MTNQKTLERYNWWKEEILKKKFSDDEGLLSQCVKNLNNGKIEFKDFIIEETNYLPENCRMLERLYHVTHDIKEPVKCEYCGIKNVKFVSFFQGYTRNCSPKCGRLNEESQKKYKESSKMNHGENHWSQTDEGREKLSNIQKEIYSDEERKWIEINKKRNTYFDRTGYWHQMWNPEILKKITKKAEEKRLLKPIKEVDPTNKIKCEECGELLKMITAQHIQKCSGLTLEEYKNKHPDAKIIDDSLKDYRIENCQNMSNSTKIINCSGCEKEIIVSLNNPYKIQYCDECKEPEKYYDQLYVEEKDLVVCQICWVGLEQITSPHCNLHDITVQEYRKKFPYAPVTNKKLLISRKENATGKFHTKETIEKLSKSHTHTAEDYKRNYPWIFNQIEEIKEGENHGDILARCKNHKCENSKEKGGWFKVRKDTFGERIRSLSCDVNDPGHGGNFLYCSDECKQECPLYRRTINDLMNLKPKNHNLINSNDYSVWREEILKRDGYKCVFCEGTEKLNAHHIIPVKKNDFFIFDVENGITLCKKCHHKIGHTDEECTYHYLRNLIC